MRVLKFCIDEQKISKMPGCDFSNIARGSSDYLKVHLSVWQSTTDNNVWEPGVYGWEEV